MKRFIAVTLAALLLLTVFVSAAIATDKLISFPSKPTADFYVTPQSGKAPLKVSCYDESLGSPSSWTWNFGDGTYSTSRNPSHTYTTAGKYVVSLTVTNVKGSATKTMCGYIGVSK
jgi:FOG: PKD repeat